MDTLGRRAAAEGFGTFWLVFGGCGSAVLAASISPGGMGQLGVALAFGLSVVTMGYAVAHISGAHLNPAVSIGLAVGGRFPARDLPAYIAAQVVGAVLAAFVLLAIASGKTGFSLADGFATNGYGAHSPGSYSLAACWLAEVVLTFAFLWVIMGCTDPRAPAGFAPLAIGLALALIHLVAIPVTNTSVNPARSTGPALVVSGWAIRQLWMFWLAPTVGAVLGAASYRLLTRPAAAQAREPIRGAPAAAR